MKENSEDMLAIFATTTVTRILEHYSLPYRFPVCFLTAIQLRLGFTAFRKETATIYVNKCSVTLSLCLSTVHSRHSSSWRKQVKWSAVRGEGVNRGGYRNNSQYFFGFATCFNLYFLCTLFTGMLKATVGPRLGFHHVILIPVPKVKFQSHYLVRNLLCFCPRGTLLYGYIAILPPFW